MRAVRRERSVHRAGGRRQVGWLAVLAMIAAACGSGGSSPSPDPTSPSGPTQTATTPTGPTDTGSPAEPADPLAPQPLAERATVRFGVTGLVGSYAPFIVADALGEFEAENIEVDVNVLPPTDSLALLIQGDLDVVGSQISPGLLNVVAEDTPIRVVFPGGGRPADSLQGLWVNRQIFSGDTFSPSDLVGATIAGPGGNRPGLWSTLFEWLKSEGVDIGPDDVEWQDLTSADSIPALQRGAVDAAFGSAPFHAELIDDPCCEHVPGAISPLPGVFYVMSERMTGADREVGLAFIRALLRTQLTYMQGDYRTNDDVVNALADAQGIPADTVRSLDPSAFEDMELHDDALAGYQLYYREIDPDLLRYEGLIPPGDVYDRSFLDELGR